MKILERVRNMFWTAFLQNKMILYMLLVVNIFGTIYGYYWYGWQLKETDFPLVLFVPDSPTASLFFCGVLFLWLMKRQSGTLEALAILSLIKYGIWAVIMNLLVMIVYGNLHWTGYMLMFSHALMAFQAVLYFPFYRIRLWQWGIGALWLLQNDFLDYVFGVMPYYSVVNLYPKEIGYFTFWLSVIVIGICYFGYTQTKLKNLQIWKG